MKYKIAYTLQMDEGQVSVKATTTDHLGYIGEGKGIAAQVIVTIKGWLRAWNAHPPLKSTLVLKS